MLAQKVVDLEQRQQNSRRGSEQKEPAELRNVFYPAENEQQSPQKSSPAKSVMSANPFDLTMTPKKPESKSVNELIAMFGSVNFQQVFGTAKMIKLNQMYNILTSKLGWNLLVADLKALNSHIQSTEAGDVEFLDQDESIINLPSLQKCLPSFQADQES